MPFSHEQTSLYPGRGALEARVVQKRKHLLSSSPRQQSHERLERTPLRREESNRDGGKQGKVGSSLAHSVRVALLSVQRGRGTVDWTLEGGSSETLQSSSLESKQRQRENASEGRGRERSAGASLGLRSE